LLIKHALPSYQQNGEKLPHLIDVLWKILISISKDNAAGEICCLLDALDECKEADKIRLMSFLNAFYARDSPQNKNSRLKFLVTSRPYHDISRQFRHVIHLSGDDESETIKDEINQVIKIRVQAISEELGLKMTDQQQFENALLSVQNRTYLWLHLILEEIQKSIGLHRWSSLEKFLKKLPTSVEDTYEKILEKCHNPEQVRRLLHIILGVKRPLNTAELNVASNVSPHWKNCRDVNLDTLEHFEKDIRYMTGLFITIVDSKVYLIHQTAREFLVNPENIQNADAFIKWRRSFSTQQTNYILAEICVTILSLDHFSDCPDEIGYSVDESNSDRKIYNDIHGTMLGYAASYWGRHFKHANIDKENSVYLASCEMFKKMAGRDDDISITVAPPMFPELYKRLYYGHTARVEALLSIPGTDVNETFADGDNALIITANRGHTDTVKWLLARDDINVNAGGNLRSSPLEAAAYSGRIDIVKLLLARPNIDTKAIGFGALQAAALSGKLETFKILLAHEDTDINTSYDGFTALHTAAESGHTEICELLLAREELDVNAVNTSGHTALYLAIFNNRTDFVRTLLRHPKIEVNAGRQSEWTILELATRISDSEIVGLLLDHKTIDLEVNKLKVLCNAADRGCGSIVRMLLAHPNMNVSEIDSRTWIVRSDLFKACIEGDLSAFKSLLGRTDVDIDALGSYKDNALRTAAQNGHIEILRLLLVQENINVNAFDGAPLRMAVKFGHTQAVRLLLDDRNIDVNASAHGGGTVLQNISPTNYVHVKDEIINMLLDHKDINVNGNEKPLQASPLHKFAYSGNLKVVKRLLNHEKINFNPVDMLGETPLHMTVCRDNIKTLQLLLTYKEVNVNAITNEGKTAVFVAAMHGRRRCVESLLHRKDIDINIPDETGQTALGIANAIGYENIVRILETALKDSAKST
jgi:ankyrin repeat protein